MYPFYNPQFVKFEHERRAAQIDAATLQTRIRGGWHGCDGDPLPRSLPSTGSP